MSNPAIAPKPAAMHFWTADEFIAWLQPGVHADLLDGEVYMHSPANIRHAELLNFVFVLMTLYVQARKLGSVQRENWVVRLSSRRVVMPDLCYFRPEQRAAFQETYSPVAPTLVVEAVSPWSLDRDRLLKFSAYEERGVNEYWILDPDQRDHDFHRRDGEFLVEYAATGERIDSQSIAGFWVERAWLNPSALPDVLACLRQLGVV
jgi:Uma2 family endonuclease